MASVLALATYAIKLPVKILHQTLALMIHRNLVRFEFKSFNESWPLGSQFNEPPFRGLLFCKLEVSLEQLMITNIWARENEGSFFYFKPNFVHFLRSKHLEEAQKPSGDPSKIIFHQKLVELARIHKHRVHVLQKLNGEILVIDGTHRLLACFLRDNHLENVDFFVSLHSPSPTN